MGKEWSEGEDGEWVRSGVRRGRMVSG